VLQRHVLNMLQWHVLSNRLLLIFCRGRFPVVTARVCRPCSRLAGSQRMVTLECMLCKPAFACCCSIILPNM